ncbi:hypothetical protein VTP01DRAFT_8118 [Rhizomucor pusillus]|uniref:uncharacterized protein n=1 Tax=Rhizomucor pusillus TaxID=4840 RepID=UPI003744010F
MSLKDKMKQVLSMKQEKFTRRVAIDAIVRQEYHDTLQERISQLCTFVREVVVRAQILVNTYVIARANEDIPTYIYSQAFWYSTCQLVMGKEVNGTNPDMPQNIKPLRDAFSLAYPEAVYNCNIIL